MTAVVSDNAANITAALRLMQVVHIPCAAHTLQLSLRLVWNRFPQIEEMVEKFRGLVTYYQRSSSALTRLEECQTSLGLQRKKVIQDVITRWNSTFDMLTSVLECQGAIVLELGENEHLHHLPSSEMWELGKQLCWVLHLFKLATIELSAERNISSSLVLPMLSRLRMHLNSPPPFHPFFSILTEFRTAVLADMTSRATNYPHALFAASFLDPRFKRLEWMSRPESRDQLIRKIQEEITHIHSITPTSSSTLPSSSSSSSHNWETLWGDRRNNNNNEIHRYLNETAQAEHNVSPLLWWRAHQAQLPRLAVLARKYLCAPATSTPSERVFSTSGDIIGENRGRIDPDMADSLIFLHANLSVFPNTL